MATQASHIRHLLPLRGLPEPVLDYIAQQAWREQAHDGEDLYALEGLRESVYLSRGKVTIILENGNTRQIEPGTLVANIPLIGPKPDNALRAVCDGTVELLCLPRDLIASIYTSWWATEQKESAGIELKEDNLEDQIYMNFYQQIQAGDYELPSMPDIAMKIAKAAENPHSSSDHLARIITADPPHASYEQRTVQHLAGKSPSHTAVMQ